MNGFVLKLPLNSLVSFDVQGQGAEQIRILCTWCSWASIYSTGAEVMLNELWAKTQETFIYHNGCDLLVYLVEICVAKFNSSPKLEDYSLVNITHILHTYSPWIICLGRKSMNIYYILVSYGTALDYNSPEQRSYICPCVPPPRQPATDGVCWPLARRWASSSSGSDEACSSPGSRAPWYCGGTHQKNKGSIGWKKNKNNNWKSINLLWTWQRDS